ncbi:uncharacterized protein LOC107426219 [Ziziphus jujuba]|uniref:Uncharacterized protein LOC107426219 n=1 Tax=Ziziphus jujuba TaxID=326968 RepID=A0A6P4ART7_ZIZJJ|nr:uncharacterized protein LOC107426219 [Ziziphus jujuba]
MDHPKGTVIFSTVGRPYYGFDLFALQLQPKPTLTLGSSSEICLSDGLSINFNGQFVDNNHTFVFISERTGSPRIYQTRPGLSNPQLLPSVPESLFHDRPIVKNGTLYFTSAHEPPHRPFDSWSALYAAALDGNKITRLTPYGSVDYSPAVSRSGKFVAVASYGSRPWGGEFHELCTDIVVFQESEPTKRVLLSLRGGWPTWSGDDVIYFHRQADDGWWSIYQVDFPGNLEFSGLPILPVRVTPPGVHCFTPAAMHDGQRIAVATRRRGNNFRHIEVFDVESKKFHPITGSINPNFHHYSPFVSPDSKFIGYHRFRGESVPGGESVIPRLDPVRSPIKELRMLRLNGSFPSFSPKGDLVAFNPDFDVNPGVKIVKSDGSECWTLKIVKSDGSKCWTLLTGRTAFCNSWSPSDSGKHVIYTSVGPIFESVKAAVQIARITFDPSDLVDDRSDIPCDVKILTGEDTGNNAFPSCSPDGKSLVFRSGRSGHKNLYILDALNGELEDRAGVRKLTEGPWIDTMPSWSPKGDLIAFSSNRHNPDNAEAFSVYVIKPDGSCLRRIYVAGPEGSDDADRERINHVCFSKDGNWLLFTANLGGVTAEPVSWPNQFQPYGDLYMVRLDGSGLRRLTWNGYENGTPAWNSEDELDVDRLCLEGGVGDVLKGQFDEPLWISCDF